MAFTYNGQSFETVAQARQEWAAERLEEESFALAAKAENDYERFLETNDRYAWECQQDDLRAGCPW